jgi:hypothetical protein
MPHVSTQAFVTDVGNDILYDVPVPTILGWVAECVERLRQHGAAVTIIDMPLFTIERLGPARFKFFRSVFVPSCRLSLSTVATRARELNEGLVSISRSEDLRLVRLKPEWYGIDPIHIRPKHWTAAWHEILAVDSPLSLPSGRLRQNSIGSLRLYAAAPDRRWLCGVEQRSRQPVIRTGGGTSVWLY